MLGSKKRHTKNHQRVSDDARECVVFYAVVAPLLRDRSFIAPRGAVAHRMASKFARMAARRAGRLLEVGEAGTWFRIAPAPPVDCSRRTVLSRLLIALACAHRDRPLVPCSAAELVAAGWPDEKITPAAARNRLHVSLNRLRELGLRSVLITKREGHLLDTSLEIRFVEGPLP